MGIPIQYVSREARETSKNQMLLGLSPQVVHPTNKQSIQKVSSRDLPREGITLGSRMWGNLMGYVTTSE